jgi:hypothetical protein
VYFTVGQTDNRASFVEKNLGWMVGTDPGVGGGFNHTQGRNTIRANDRGEEHEVPALIGTG